ncbi:MAG: Cna B-type domain-containing protein [Firmicutes bacterium]|nr:Cna B-type domain-containing protein [Bacillota bacterium]
MEKQVSGNAAKNEIRFADMKTEMRDIANRRDTSSRGEKMNKTKTITKGKRALALLLAVIIGIGGAIADIGGIITRGGVYEAYADDLKNTVPNGEVTQGTDFYTGTISTGFVPNGYNTQAQYGPDYGPYTVDGVFQSQSTTSATSFAAGLPLGTIFIDQSKINASGGIYKKVSDDPAILAGLVDGVNSAGNRTQMYDGTLEGAIKLEPNKINRLDGDLYSMTFEDAAILPNGDRADLVITYSNARIVIDQRYASAPVNEQYLHGAVYLSRGNEFSRGTTDKTNFGNVSYRQAAQSAVNATAGSYGDSFENSKAPTPAVGITMDATYTIINKNKTPAEGTFVFAISGINLDRDPDVGGGNNVNKPLWYSYNNNFGGEDGTEHSFFSEAMSINGGQVSDNVYLRPNNNLEDNPEKITGVKGQYFWPNVSKDATTGQIKFISNATPSLGGNDNSYNAGFVVLADASQGLTVTATGHGGGNATGTMQSGVFVSKQIWYRYTSSTGDNGNIQITSEGNFNGKLDDGGDVLGQGTYVIAEGKTVKYTMTPDYGYKISTLQIAKADGTLETVTFNGDDVNKMKKGDQTTWTTAAGKTGTLKYELDGTYTFEYPYAEHDEKIHVEWEPTTADILFSKAWYDDNDKDGMRKGADSDRENGDPAKWPKVKLQRSLNGGLTWSDVATNAYGDPITAEDVPSGKDTDTTSQTVGQYLDGVYTIDKDNGSGTVPHPYTWQYLPMYQYDSNGKTAGEILYRIVEGTPAQLADSSYETSNPKNEEVLEGYHKPVFYDVQQFNLISDETKTIDGLQIYRNAAGDEYVLKSDDKYYPVTNWEADNQEASPQPKPSDLSAAQTSDLKKIDVGGTKYQVLRNNSSNSKYRGKEYVQIGSDYYRVVYNEKSKVAVTLPTDAAELADFKNMTNATLNGFNTADKADPYKSVAVRNEHDVSDIDVEVTKEWNDAYLWDSVNNKPIDTEVLNGNEYNRRDITFTLHGTIGSGSSAQVVDLDESDPNNTDLTITLSKDELNARVQTAGGETVYVDTADDNGTKYVRKGSGSTTDPYVYHKVTAVADANATPQTAGSYESAAATPPPQASNLEEAVNTAYKVDGSHYGAIFEGLQAYHEGQLIKYTVTESFTQADSFTVTGGTIAQVTETDSTTGKVTVTGYTMSDLDQVKENQDLKGYKANFTNTPIVEDKYEPLPIKIKKVDEYTGQPLANAEFTVYTDPAIDEKPKTSTYKQIDGLTVLEKLEEETYTDAASGSTYTVYKEDKTKYVRTPKGTDSETYDYYIYDNGTVDFTTPAATQPTNPSVSYVSTGNRYVKKTDGKYYAVTGNTIATTAADPQPDAASLGKEKNTNYKKVTSDGAEYEVYTDKKGHNYIQKNGEYYEVDIEGNVAAKKADPQPQDPSNTLTQVEVEGQVDEIVVVTDANGEATVTFNETGIYTIIETKAPAGYTADTDQYQFEASKELKEVKYLGPNGDHDTHWWQRLYDLIFGSRTNNKENWKAANDKRTGTLTVEDTPVTANVLVRKVWDDKNDQDGRRPNTDADLPTMTLQYTTKNPTEAAESDWKTAQIYNPDRKSETDPTKIDPGMEDVKDKKTTYAGGAIHKDDNNAYTWTDLPAYRDGKVVYYRIKETGTVIDDDKIYTITSNKTVATGEESFKLVDKNTHAINQIVEVTNSHTPQTLSITATKRWIDNDNALENRPGTLMITLWKEVDNQEIRVKDLTLDGKGVKVPEESEFDANEDGTIDESEKAAYDAAVAAANAEINTGMYETEPTENDNTWNAIFKDLPAYANGAPIKYRLEETLEGESGYVNKYYVNYTNTNGTTVTRSDADSLLANDIERTFNIKDEEIKVGEDTYKVYIKNGKKYVRTGAGTEASPYVYYEIDANGSVDLTKKADPQPKDPVLSKITTETTQATLRVDNTSKNYAKTKKYWLGGANANIRFHLYRTAVTQYVNSNDAEEVISRATYNGLTDDQKANYKPVVPAMESKTSTAEPIKSGTTITVGSDTYDVYNHANGKYYVDKSTTDTPEWHEILGKGTTDEPYSIATDEAEIKINTWTPYDLDASGNPKNYVNKTNSSDVITKADYDALSNEAKANYEITLNPAWEKVTDGTTVGGEHLFVSSAFSTSLTLPGDDEVHDFHNLPEMDANGNPYVYRIFETTTSGDWIDDRFEGHYSDDGLTVTNINRLMEEGSTNVDVLKDLSGRDWDAKFKKTGVEADKDIFYFWIEPIKGINPDTGEIIEFGDSDEDQAAKAKVPLPGNGQQYGRALSQNTAVGTTAREVSFSPILYDATDILDATDSTIRSREFYYKVYEAKDNKGTIVEEKDDKGITYDDDTEEDNVWSPKTEVLKVVASADANNVVTTEHSWEKIIKNETTGDVSGIEWTTETPIFKNTYASASEAKAWIEKNVQSREWEDYANGEGDAYQFTITSISGANLNTPGATEDDSYTSMPLVTSTTSNNPQKDLQQLSDSMWAFGLNGNPYTGDMLGKNGEAYFIYEITENPSATSDSRDSLGLSDYTVDGLTYDSNKIFAKVKVSDNWDGTLSFDVHYYTDASCKDKFEITRHKVWIVDKTLTVERYINKNDANDIKTPEEYADLPENSKLDYTLHTEYQYISKADPSVIKSADEYKAMSETDKAKYTNHLKRLLTEQERTAAEEMKTAGKTADLEKAGYREVNVAHFENYETVDIPVKKQWIDGPAVEDVTLHLERHLFPLTDEAQLDGDNGVSVVEAKEALWIPENYRNKTNYDDVKTPAEYNALRDDQKENYELSGDFWQRIGYVYDVKRGEFLKSNGDPKYDSAGSKTSTKLIENEEGFNKDLPKYVVKNGITYRAVYMLIENDTSDAYTREYDPKYYINDKSFKDSKGNDTGALVVKNTVVAKNTANIAAVKQLQGRNWLTSDDFEFELTPYGVAVYDDKDNITSIDTTDAGKAKVPMPADNGAIYSTTTITGYVSKTDATVTKTATEYDALPKIAKSNYEQVTGDETKYVNKEDPDDIITAEVYNALADGPSKLDFVAKEKSNTHAKTVTTTVDPNGNLERLARFGAITYTAEDLDYAKTGKEHLQGDFFYIMKEKLPTIVTTGDNPLYPVEYTVVKNKGASNETTETKTIDNKAMPTLATGETLKSVKFNNGITYDCDEHYVHVRVREDRTRELSTQVAYDETGAGTNNYKPDITKGTQFTPVYTNTYDAETEFTVKVNKYIRGREWQAGDNFDFRMIPMAGAPFKDAHATDFPVEDTYDHADRNQKLDAGNAVHNKEGEHVKRVKVPSEMVGTYDPIDFTYPAIKITLADLNKITTAETQKEPEENKPDTRVYDKNGNLLPVGTVYGQFMYAIEETDEFDDVNTNHVKDLARDPDTEYARVTVYDIGNGKLEHYVEVFGDRYGSQARYVPDPATGENTSVKASVVTFVNKLQRDLSVTKAWAGTATEDVTLKLQWSIDGTSFYDVDGTDWFPNVVGTKEIPKNATGSELTATWENLPAYANIKSYSIEGGSTGADILDLNDKWVYYQVKEVSKYDIEGSGDSNTTPRETADIRYNELPYEPGELITNIDKYKTDAYHTGPQFKEKSDPTDQDEYLAPDDRVKQMYVTNFPKNITEEVSFGVVKQYIGKNWTNESFTFKATPVRSKIGGESAPVDEGAERKIINYVHKDTKQVITEAEFNAITDTEKAKYDKHETTVTNKLPTFKNNNNEAIADINSKSVSVNEHAANFAPIIINRTDLALNPTTGKMEGEFVYKITEVVPNRDVKDTVEVCGKDINGNDVKYKVAKDARENNIKYTTEEHIVIIFAEDNGEEIHTEVRFDDRGVGEFVPVYTNYALMKTPVEGTKTWVGGTPAEHVNGVVNLNGDSTAVVDNAETPNDDMLGLELKRKLDKEGSNVETVSEDDAGRPLEVVWVKRTPNTETVPTGEYELSEDTKVIDGKTYYSKEDDNYTPVDNPEGDPSGNGWYEAETEDRTTYTYVKQEGGDGNGPYTYIIMAKDGEKYVDPYLNAVDEDGYIYDYYIEETEKQTDYVSSYTDSIKGLHITNTNVKADSVVVTKEWVGGPAVEDVTLHLKRMLVPVSKMDGVDYDYLANLNEDVWETVGLVYNAERGDFVNADGTPKYDEELGNTASKDYIEKDFNKDLPMYVTENGVDYRAIYKLEEDNTSDAYVATYRTERTELTYVLTEDTAVDPDKTYYTYDSETEEYTAVTAEGTENPSTEVWYEEKAETTILSNKGGYYLNMGDNPVVTNTVTATNTANIAAVKQLLGREWQEGDDFAFALEPVGKATYYSEDEANRYNEEHAGEQGFTPVKKGDFKEITSTDDAKESVPMPEPDTDRESTTEGAGTKNAKSTTHAKNIMDTVDPNGGLERLARFGAINFDVNDLVFDPSDGHMQGDFFYVMKEVVPADAKNASGNAYGEATVEEKAAGGFSKDGITYDSKEHTVHVKVRENRTGKLQVQIAYDYDTTRPEDITTGTQFTPVYTNKAETTSATITKVWADQNNKYNTRPEVQEFTLMRVYEGENGDPITPVRAKQMDETTDVPVLKLSVEDKDTTDITGNTWKETINNLPKYKLVAVTTEGVTTYVSRPISYYWQEVVPEGYTASGVYEGAVNATTNPTGAVSQVGGNSATILVNNNSTLTNTLTGGELVVTKTWDDENDTDGLRAEAITAFKTNLKLYANGEEVTVDTSQTPAADSVTKTVTDATGSTPLTVTYKNLPVKDASGKAITYTVDEGTISGYALTDATASATTTGTTLTVAQGETTAKGTLALVNKHVPGTTELVITKSWDDSNNADGKRPTIQQLQAALKLYADGTEKTGVTPTVSFNTDGTWTVKWANLPAKKNTEGTSDGIVYTAKEVNVNITGSDTVATGFDYYVNGASYDNSEALNTDYVTLANEQKDDTTQVYNGGTITNKQTLKDVKVRKYWVDKVNNASDAQDTSTPYPGSSIRPANITLKLVDSNGDTLKDVNGADLSKTVASGTDASLEVLFEKLPIYTKDSTTGAWTTTEVAYTLDENVVPNYTKTTFDLGGVKGIVNTYKMTKFTGTKVWVDGGKVHDNVSELKDKLSLERTINPTGADGWAKVTDDYHIHWNSDGAKSGGSYTQSFEITGLPVMDVDGNDYIYRVVESSVGGDYVTTYTNVANPDTAAFAEENKTDAIYTGGTITNKLEAKIQISGEKYWTDGEPTDHINTDLGLTLHRESKTNGGSVEEDVKDAVITGSWSADEGDGLTGDATYTFGTYDDYEGFTAGEYDKYDPQGYEYIYTVKDEEGCPDGYTPTYHGLDVNNKFNPVHETITPEFIKKAADMPQEVIKAGGKEFTFLLAPQTDTADKATANPDKVTTVTVPGNGDANAVTFDFGEFTFTEEGIYTYKLVEIPEDGWTSDREETTFTIEVVDNNGTLEGTINWPDGAPTSNGKLVITNTYNPAAVTSSVTDQIELTKEITGDDRTLKAEEFSFTMTGLSADDAGDGYADASGKNATGTNKADGTVAMSKVGFSEPGKYAFEIAEESGTLPGITYADTKYTVVATVTGNDNGKLDVAWSILKKDEAAVTETSMTFSNEYDDLEISESIKVNKILEGRDLADEEFEFILAGDGENQAKKNVKGAMDDTSKKATGAVNFDDIKFTLEDLCDHNGSYMDHDGDGEYSREFTYTLFEKSGTIDGVLYDGDVHELKATLKYIPAKAAVADDPETTDVDETAAAVDAHLEVTWTLDEQAVDFKKAEPDTVDFENKYDPNAVSSSLTDTYAVNKEIIDTDGKGRKPEADEFIFKLEGQPVGTKGNNGTAPVDSTVDASAIKLLATNDINGKVEFGKIPFSKVGVYVFKLTELVGNDATIDPYDEAVRIATATVTDNKDGSMSVEWNLIDESAVEGTPADNPTVDQDGKVATFTNATVQTTVDKPVRIVWVNDTEVDDTLGQDGTVKDRPESVTVTLQKQIDTDGDGTPDTWVDVEEPDVANPGQTTGKPWNVELTTDNAEDDDPDNWFDDSYTGLPKFDQNGKEVKYRVVQSGFKSPAKTVAPNAVDNGDGTTTTDSTSPAGYSATPFNIGIGDGISTLANLYQTVSINGTKVWVDGDQSHNNSSEVKFIVQRSVDGNTWTDLVEGTDYSVVWSGSNDQNFDIRGLTRYADSDHNAEYQYKVVEDVPENYTATYETSSGAVDSIVKGTTITNTAEMISIYAEKQWAGDLGHEGDRSEVKFTLYKTVSGKKQIVGEKTLATGTNNAEELKVQWDNLPKYVGSTDTEIIYSVEETSAPEGYTVGDVVGSGTETAPFKIVNTYNSSVTSITVMKKWNDNNDQDGVRQPEIKVQLLRKIADSDDEYEIFGQPQTLSEDNNWTHIFNNLPSSADLGHNYSYIVRELDGNTVLDEGGSTGEGYKVSYSSSGTTTAITNTLIPGTTSIAAVKEWAGDTVDGTDDYYGMRTDVVLHLYGMKDNMVVYDAGTKEIPLGSDEQVVWENLPKRHYSDTDLTWKIVEEEVFGYTSSYEWEDGVCTVTNTYAGPVTKVSVTKEWQDDNDRDSKRPTEVTYELWQKAGDGEAEKIDEVTVDVASDGAANYTWDNLVQTKEVETGETETVTRYEYQDKQVTNDDGEYAYTLLADGSTVYVAEADKATYDEDTENYEPLMENVQEEISEEKALMKEVAVIYSVKEKKLKEELGYNDPIVEAVEPGEFNVINSKTEFDTVDVVVTKTWADGDNKDGVRPDHILITLKGTDGSSRSQILTTENAESANVWKYTFKDLPANKAKGEPITYSVTEATVAGYTSAVSTENPLNLINSRTVASAKTLEVTKVWKDNKGNVLEEAPEDAVFHLVRVVEGYGPQIVEGQDKTISKGSKGEDLKVKWENLIGKIDGKNVTYSVEEDSIEGYTTSMTDGVDNMGTISITVTNQSNAVDPEKVTITYKDSEGNVIRTEEIIRGENEPEAPENPSREGYTFTGWQRSTDDNGNVTYTATWLEEPEPVKILPKVTYLDPKADGEDGTGKMILQAKKYADQVAADAEASGKADKPEDPSHEGYEFTGWVVNKDEFGDYIIVATYNEIQEQPVEKVTVSYIDGQSGEPIVVRESVEDPSTVEPPAENPSHEGFSFVDWVEIKDEAGNIIFVAKYDTDCKNTPAKDTIWVRYIDEDGSTIYMDRTDIPVDGEIPVPEQPTKDGYNFKGWDKVVDPDGNITFIAQWEPVIPDTPGEKEVTPTPTPTPPAEKGNSAPLTGDENNLILWLGLLAGSTGLLVYKRRRV